MQALMKIAALSDTSFRATAKTLKRIHARNLGHLSPQISQKDGRDHLALVDFGGGADLKKVLPKGVAVHSVDDPKSPSGRMHSALIPLDEAKGHKHLHGAVRTSQYWKKRFILPGRKPAQNPYSDHEDFQHGIKENNRDMARLMKIVDKHG